MREKDVEADILPPLARVPFLRSRIIFPQPSTFHFSLQTDSRRNPARLYFYKVVFTGHKSLLVGRKIDNWLQTVATNERTDERTHPLIEEMTSIGAITQEDLLRRADKIKRPIPSKGGNKEEAKPECAIAEGSKMDGSSLGENKKTEPCKQSNGYST